METKQSECWPLRLANTTSDHQPSHYHLNSPEQGRRVCRLGWQMAEALGPCILHQQTWAWEEALCLRTVASRHLLLTRTDLPSLQIRWQIRLRVYRHGLHPRRLDTEVHHRLFPKGSTTPANNHHFLRRARRRLRDSLLLALALRQAHQLLGPRYHQGFSNTVTAVVGESMSHVKNDQSRVVGGGETWNTGW